MNVLKANELYMRSIVCYSTYILIELLLKSLLKNIYKYGEGNGNPLHYSCLENPMDRGAWWAAVHGVTRVRHDSD